MSKAILIVEDNAFAIVALEEMLTTLGYTTIYHATNYSKAIKLYKKHTPDMVLLDIDLGEDKNGIDIAIYIRKTSNIPIIYLTADTDEETIHRASLTLPSNYINKPFTCKEIKTAMTLAWCTHKNHVSHVELLQLSAYYQYDYVTENLYEEGRAIHLTPNEKLLIEVFCKHKKQTISASSLINLIWMGDAHYAESTLRTLFYRLNKKLKHTLFETIPYVGYRLYQEPTIPADEEKLS